MLILLAATALFLAFSNGANDNFKGFATSWGSATLSYRAALILSNLTTLAGGIVSIVLADGLLKQFSGRGLVADDVAQTTPFTFAVAGGAGLTVALATRLGFPISTTHAIVGGLVGAGMASGSGVAFDALGKNFFVPLLLSPLLSALLGLLIFGGLRMVRRNATTTTAEMSSADQSAVAEEAPALRIVHIISAATICFARAVNDTPKLAALMLGAGMFGATGSAIGVTIVMVAGGWLLSRRVAETMSLKISQIGSVQGVTANVITSIIVLAASKFSLPVSTTHVSVGSIIGTGKAAGTLDLSTVRSVLQSWVITLPLAALLAAILGFAVRVFTGA